jgi:hypothetical protein
MTRAAVLFALAAGLAAPDAAYALATEQLGNKPIGPGWNFGSELLAAVNVEERVYWHEVNGNPTFFFKGGSKALNEAIRRFAAVPAEKREIILLPGPGATRTFDGKPVAYDWTLHVPMGLYFGGDSEVADSRATLVIHISAPTPGPPADLAKVKQWIGELNSDDFKTREKAAMELAAVGPPVARVLRAAWKDTKSAEARDRLERVLAGFDGSITLDVLDLPKDVPVVGLEVLLDRARKELSNKSHEVRGYAASSLSSRYMPDEVVPDLEKVLTTETHEYPLRCATGSASHLGAAGKPLLSALRGLLKSTDKNVQNAAQYAIDAIEKAKPEAAPEADARERAAIRKEIREFVAGRAKAAK